MQVRWWLLQDNVRRVWPEKAIRWFVWKLPHQVMLWAYIRVVAHAWAYYGDKHPDELTYGMTYEAWESNR